MGALVGLLPWALFSINWPSKQYSHSYIGLSPDCFILLTNENLPTYPLLCKSAAIGHIISHPAFLGADFLWEGPL